MKLTLRHQKGYGIFLLPIWQQQSLIVMRQLISTEFTGRFFAFSIRVLSCSVSKTISFIEIDGHGYMGSNSSNKKTRKRKSKNAKTEKGKSEKLKMVK